MTDLGLYRRLFIHREDVFAEQLDSGAYMPHRRPLTEDDITEHLAGFWSLGSYVIRPEDQTVSYIVFDLDTHDIGLTAMLCEVVEGFLPLEVDPRCLLREVSGNKGTHVWLFLDEPVPAAKVRRWLARDFWPSWNAETDNFTLEVFPKQDAVVEGGFGNLVKLPLGKHRVSGKFSEVSPYQGWASAIEDVVPFPASLVPDIEPERETRQDHRRGDGPASPFPCVDQILHDGASAGVRNNAMFHLALYLYGHGIPHDLAEEMCNRANERFDPPLPPGEVKTTLDQAYTGGYHSANCGQDWLRGFCNGPCRGGGWSVLAEETTEGSLRKAQEGQLVEVRIVRRQADHDGVRLTVGHADAKNEPTLICC
jgi:hypothetical protein